MGNYSTAISTELEVTDSKGLARWTLADAERCMGSAKNKEELLENYKWWLEKIKEDYADESELYYLFDECKIIGYWYEHFCYFLRDMAQFIEGTVVLQGEGMDGFAQIKFHNGQVFIAQKDIQFEIEDDCVIDDYSDIQPLPEKEKLLRNL